MRLHIDSEPHTKISTQDGVPLGCSFSALAGLGLEGSLASLWHFPAHLTN